ncbi:nucleic-acid-binding protein from transposon X-element [Nephila pilipes]|uniref:Nucleic-acid-binding protein from transposon X-element n=1 Tax=Nephila pilipes TaxID=299642 RepID=A0A8X6MVQ1_NEPPI|nr:nucleic-acid-binding protein from transposon X-element [Nephila pilipes]
MSLFLVVRRKSPDIQEIYNITNIGYFRVKIEALKKNSMPAQCYIFQDFYLQSRYCSRNPKCLKCAGSGLTKDWKKLMQSICRCPYPAIFYGYSKNPINTKPVKPPTVNVWEERERQQEAKMAPQMQHTAQ